MVLDRVVRSERVPHWSVRGRAARRQCKSEPDAPAGQQLGDLGPLVAEPRLRVLDDAFLLGRPRVLLDGRVQVIEPSTGANKEPGKGGGVSFHHKATGGIIVCLYLVRHCLPVRSVPWFSPFRWSEMTLQRLVPYSSTSRMMASSSLRVQARRSYVDPPPSPAPALVLCLPISFLFSVSVNETAEGLTGREDQRTATVERWTAANAQCLPGRAQAGSAGPSAPLPAAHALSSRFSRRLVRPLLLCSPPAWLAV